MTNDYYKAQHPLEASEFVGSAAFEVLLTILLILTTAGAGAVANVASKGRLVRQMNQLGDLFRGLARLKKQVYKHTSEKQTRSRSSGNMVEDLPEDDRPVPKASEPPKGEQKKSSENDSKQSVLESSAVSKLAQQSHAYTELVNSNKPWSWKDFPEGDKLTVKQKKAIKTEAIDQGLIPDIQYKGSTKYPDFESAGLIEKVDELPEELWKESDYKQFKWLDSRIEGGRPEGYTWHHSEISGRMELVPFGPHNSINPANPG